MAVDHVQYKLQHSDELVGKLGSIAEYVNQLYLLDRKILQVGATHLPAWDQVYMVIMKLKEQKNLAIRAKVMK